MKLYYLDSKQQKTLLCEADNMVDIKEFMIKDLQRKFVYNYHDVEAMPGEKVRYALTQTGDGVGSFYVVEEE